MSKNKSTPCVRCGKIRILAKTWKEKKGDATLTFRQYVCPDPECQEIVDKKLKKEKDRIERIQERSKKRRKRNVRNRRAKKAKKINQGKR